MDVGVHQDGLVHISHLADRRVSDPRDVVKVGDIVKVRVLEVDLARQRISLSMRSEGAQAGARSPSGHPLRRAIAGAPWPLRLPSSAGRGSGRNSAEAPSALC